MDTRKFSHERWDKLLLATVDSINSLAKNKGGEYAGDDDRLGNFRRNAQALGTGIELVWAVYAGKHWDAIQQWVKDLQTGKDRVRSEPLASRVDNLIVYCILLKAILKEREEGPRQQSQGKSGGQKDSPSREAKYEMPNYS